VGIGKNDLTPQKSEMYQIHLNVQSKLSKLRNLLKRERAHLTSVRNLYNDGRFDFIEHNLNDVTKEFINSQLRNVHRKPSGRRWTIQDKAFALSMYKKSPRLYRYLQAYFQLPSTRTLKHLLSKIPFECGLVKPVIENLKLHVESMDELDRCCTLIFDEVSLCKDLGSLRRTDRYANHALVFMVRGIRKNYKQTVAYYFTRDTVKTHQLKQIIVYIIKQLQEVGLNVVATVCDQGSTNRTAIKELCGENRDRPSPFFFVVDGKRISTIFDVPHLLKNTRNALIDCGIEFSKQKVAKFKHIQAAFNLDQQTRTYRLLPKLKNEYFNFKDSYVKMKVKVAAQQLSHTVAAAIETFSDKGKLPIKAMHTAEFVSFIDSLFDS
jgi:cobalamin biosynthesis Mg chelatase CobN